MPFGQKGGMIRANPIPWRCSMARCLLSQQEDFIQQMTKQMTQLAQQMAERVAAQPRIPEEVETFDPLRQPKQAFLVWSDRTLSAKTARDLSAPLGNSQGEHALLPLPFPSSQDCTAGSETGSVRKVFNPPFEKAAHPIYPNTIWKATKGLGQVAVEEEQKAAEASWTWSFLNGLSCPRRPRILGQWYGPGRR